MRDSVFWRVVVTESGVYQPPLFKFEAALLTTALFVVLAFVALGHSSTASALLNLAILLLIAIGRFTTYRRHGPLGEPTVVLHEGTLVLALPQDSKGKAVVELPEFHRLIVYGRIGCRIFRFVRQDGTYIKVVPGWGPKVEQVAVEFLQRHIPPALLVTIEEPQTLFASVRGDGP